MSILDPGRLGSVLVAAEIDKVNITELINEFNLQTVSKYLQLAKLYRQNNLEQELEKSAKMAMPE